MGYLKIPNLYKDQEILLFKECYALEKIHGTSAHITWDNDDITFFSGGEKHENFVQLFDKHSLIVNCLVMLKLPQPTVIFGEAYGGKQQGMKETYGDKLKFVVFDIKIRNTWLNVPDAEKITKDLEEEFVWYRKIKADIESINTVRDRWSEQAVRNGILKKKIMEGVVLKPLIELKKSNGDRIIAKHKKDEFRETLSKRKVMSPEQIKIWAEAKETAEEWVTQMRLAHILDKFPHHTINKLGTIISMMIEDIRIEGKDEISWTKQMKGAIGKNTSKLYKEVYCQIK